VPKFVIVGASELKRVIREGDPFFIFVRQRRSLKVRERPEADAVEFGSPSEKCNSTACFRNSAWMAHAPVKAARAP
jgi:hypothetical protein